MTIFSTPRLQRPDMGVNEFDLGMGDRLGAAATEAVHEMPLNQLFDIAELQTAKGEREDLGGMISRVQAGEDPSDVISGPQPKGRPEMLPMEARERVKESGLDKVLTIPDGAMIKPEALDIMMERARGRQERAATIARGPQGIVPTALDVGTSFLVGALDPINVGAAFIPVVGELRYAKMMATAGETAMARLGPRLLRGGAEGAVGMAAIEPIAWYAKTQEGRDYGMADALRSVVFGVGLGATLRTGGGAIVDRLRLRSETPLFPYGPKDPLEYHTPWEELRMQPARTDFPIGRTEEATYVGRPGESITLPERPAAPGEPARAAEDIAAPESVAQGGGRAQAGAEGPEAAAVEPRAERVPSAVMETIADLPPRAQEDSMRAATAALVQGEPVKVGEMLNAAAQSDPRIAESIDAGRVAGIAHAAELSEPAREVFSDIRAQLIRAGMNDAEAEANSVIVAARYEARAARLQGAAGTAADLYRAEGIRVRGPKTPTEELSDEIGRAFNQAGRLEEGQLDMFRQQVQRLPDEAIRDYRAEFERVRAEYYTPERLHTMQTEFVMTPERQRQWRIENELPEQDLPYVEPHILEMFRAGASSEEINAALTQARADRDRRRAAAMRPGDWQSRDFGQRRRRDLEGQTDLPGFGTISDAELAQQRRAEMKKIGEGKPVHTLAITPDLRKAATEQGFPLFQRDGGDLRGRITLADNRAIIDLFSRADKSTFMHETGHLWLDELMRDGARLDAPQGVRDDATAVLSWLGAARADAITTDMHEKWASAFEQYLATGKAPSEGLRAAFDQFKQWLIAIYKSLAGIGEEVPPEIRAVMDRMIATEEQIAQAKTPAQVVAGPRPARGARARDPETWSLLEFLAHNGGIRADDPLISDVRSSIGRDNKLVPGFGQLIRAPRALSTAERRGGRSAAMTLDQAREAAVEAGYLHEAGDVTGGEAKTSINTLLEAVDRELRGQRVYRIGREQETKGRAIDADEEIHYINSEIDAALKETGTDPVHVDGRLRDRVIEIMRSEGERDPLVAYERAVMEDSHNGAESERNTRIGDHIPGWDVPIHDDTRAAQAAGGSATRVGQPGGEGAGGASRAAGAADSGQRRDAAWHNLAATTRDFNDPAIVAASKAADALPEPPSLSSDKRLQAIQKSEEEAILQFSEAEAYLPADIREKVAQDLRLLDQEAADTQEVVRRGAACLAAGVVGVA